MEELAEGLWDSEKYELEVEMYNDGSGTAPEWSIDMLKLYFLTEYEAKIVSCYGGPDQGDAGDVWINAETATILKYVLSNKRSTQGANSTATAKKGLCVLVCLLNGQLKRID